jgi:hypothetical protein
VLVGEVEDGLLAELFLGRVEHEGVTFEGLLFGHWDPICETG